MAANHPIRRAAPRSRLAPVLIVFAAGATLAILLFGGMIGLYFALTHQAEEPAPPPVVFQPAPPVPLAVAPPTARLWWEGLPDSALAETAALLRVELPQHQALFDRIGDRSDTVRRDGYRELLAQTPELLRRPQPRRLLARLLCDCYALEPAEANVAPLQLWLVKELPEENAEFSPKLKGDDLERSFWALEVCLSALGQKAIPAERRKHLADALGTAFGLAIDLKAPAADLKADVEQQLARRCYRKLGPTATASLEQALALREALLRAVPHRLEPVFRAKRDVEVALNGLPQASKAWPAYLALLRDCLKSNAPAVHVAIVDLYAQAEPALAAQLEPVLAVRWSVAADRALDRTAKLRALRKTLGIPDPAARLEVLAKVVEEARKVTVNPANKRNATLQETARLAHASTLACALWQKAAGLAKFDELLARVPSFDQTVAVAKREEANPATVNPAGPAIAAGGQPIVLRGALVPGVSRRTHSVALQRGHSYAMHMVSPFDNFLYLYSSNGRLLAQDDDSGGGLNALIRFTASVDGVYRVVASSFGGRGAGPYTITIQETPFGMGGFFVPRRGRPPGPPFPFAPAPPMVPNVVVQAPAPADTHTLVEEGDLAALLDKNLVPARIAALQRIVTKLPTNLAQNDLATRPAQALAKYLATIKTDGELEDVLPKLTPLAKSPKLLLALADRMDQDAELQASEAVVGALVQQPLRFGKDDPWRLSCRKLLLRQALRLSARSDTAAQAADVLRSLYAEQALVLGIDPAALKELARPSQVLGKLIETVAGTVVRDKLAGEDKEYLDQVAKELALARFLAQNDLEHMALLQRVWIRVLPIYLTQQNPERAAPLRQVARELFEADRVSRTVLDQLRGGEEKILRVWSLAHDVK